MSELTHLTALGGAPNGNPNFGDRIVRRRAPVAAQSQVHLAKKIIMVMLPLSADCHRTRRRLTLPSTRPRVNATWKASVFLARAIVRADKPRNWPISQSLA